MQPLCNLFDIQRSSFVDGPGIRTAVFFKGCNLRCQWCHNPESQSAKPQVLFYKHKCAGCGRCKGAAPEELSRICPTGARRLCGYEMTVEDLLSVIEKDRDFYAVSGGGATFSGGECMLQIEALQAILRRCKESGIHTAVDTAGCVPWPSFEAILPDTDLFLYDIKLMDPAKHKQYIGVDNALILENLKRLSQIGKDILIRVPVISGVNDDEIGAIADFVKGLGIARPVELLPYHALGESKRAALGEEQQTFEAPSAERLEQLRKLI